MTEKQYGGNTGRGTGGKSIKNIKTINNSKQIRAKNEQKKFEHNEANLNTNKEKIIQAGKIASQVRKFAKAIIKKDVSLLEIAEKIENKIRELGGKPAFPTNLSTNEIAAHCTPSYNDESKASGLLKIDFGIHVDGHIADTAFSIDLENSELNSKLIRAVEESLNSAKNTIKNNVLTSEIGKAIQRAIESNGFSPIINLSGHEIGEYNLHAGLTIPNIDDKNKNAIKKGLYAIEPFSTNGSGKVRDGKPSGIYMLTNTKAPRSQTAREILEYIFKEYQTLPFCSRWLIKKFGVKVIFGLKELEQNGNLHQYAQLIEAGNGVVAQAEHTFLVEENEAIVTTE